LLIYSPLSIGIIVPKNQLSIIIIVTIKQYWVITTQAGLYPAENNLFSSFFFNEMLKLFNEM